MNVDVLVESGPQVLAVVGPSQGVEGSGTEGGARQGEARLGLRMFAP